ncbi:dTDP-glucose 4,6-dehydratase [Streptomyces sp. NPDC001985]|uniref:dTDP-glucose 4,6-dehydratase n=1 Tax=Streptomyces sp. NPDC001985 TaxID=3154406 RepID=UPI00332BA1F6
MRILVTGGAGFIGSHYVRTLLSGGYPGMENVRVTVLDKLTYSGNRDNLPALAPGLEFVHGDICDTDLVRQLMPGHDALVNFAAESHVDRSIDAAREFFRTNVMGTEVLLDAAVRAKVARVVHVSTDEVYGSIDTGSWTEDWPLAPNSPYAASKAGSDLVARSYWRTHGLDVSISRCSNNYGPHQHTEKLIPLFITNLLEGRQVPLYGDGHNIREWIHVDDHCRAVQLILTRGRAGEIYNVGGGEEQPNTAIAHRLLALCGADESAIRLVADRPGHDDRYSLDGGKLRAEVGFEPRIAFERGLRETVEWYRSHPDWWKAVKRAAEGGGAPAPVLEGSGR